MSFHERDLPHYYPPGAALFLTWRLADSLPECCREISLSSGREFARADRALDGAREGNRWLADSRVADMVAMAIRHGETDYGHYELFAWVIMPNHVHAVMRPPRPLPVVMKWLKGSTALAANRLLGRRGAFWQSETYDHCVRNSDELNRVIRYVERNPVRAGFVAAIEDWPWSSASGGFSRTG